MRAGKGPGPAPRPQPDKSHPSSPAALPEPRRLTPWLPRSRGAADAGPHAAMPGDAARSPRSLCRRKDSGTPPGVAALGEPAPCRPEAAPAPWSASGTAVPAGLGAPSIPDQLPPLQGPLLSSSRSPWLKTKKHQNR